MPSPLILSKSLKYKPTMDEKSEISMAKKRNSHKKQRSLPRAQGKTYCKTKEFRWFNGALRPLCSKDANGRKPARVYKGSL